METPINNDVKDLLSFCVNGVSFNMVHVEHGSFMMGAEPSLFEDGAVQTTFFLFLILFTVMLVAEVRIMLRAIRQQPDFTH